MTIAIHPISPILFLTKIILNIIAFVLIFVYLCGVAEECSAANALILVKKFKYQHNFNAWKDTIKDASNQRLDNFSILNFINKHLFLTG